MQLKRYACIWDRVDVSSLCVWTQERYDTMEWSERIWVTKPLVQLKDKSKAASIWDGMSKWFRVLVSLLFNHKLCMCLKKRKLGRVVLASCTKVSLKNMLNLKLSTLLILMDWWCHSNLTFHSKQSNVCIYVSMDLISSLTAGPVSTKLWTNTITHTAIMSFHFSWFLYSLSRWGSKVMFSVSVCLPICILMVDITCVCNSFLLDPALKTDWRTCVWLALAS